jgi:hypothetical protein
MTQATSNRQRRYEDATAVLALCGLLVLGEWTVVGGETMIGMDTATAFYPWYSFLGETLRAGHMPMWNPHQFSGAPFTADPESGWMYLPAMVLFTLLPLVAAAKSYTLLHVLLAGLTTYALARTLHNSVFAAMVAGIAYALSGFLYGHSLCCFAYAGVAAWLPLSLLGAERALRSHCRRSRGAWWGVAGLALSQILATWLGQGSYYAVLVLTAYLGYRTLVAPDRSDAGLLVRVNGFLLHGMGVAVFAVALAAAGLLPRLEYNALSNLAGGYPTAGVPGPPALTDWGFIQDWDRLLFVPGFYFAGGATLGLAVVALLVRPRSPSVLFLAALAVASLILARHEPTPLHAALSLLPGYERLTARSPERALIVFYLPTALLAASAVTSLQTRAMKTSIVAATLVVVVFADLHQAAEMELSAAVRGAAAYELQAVDLGAYYRPSDGVRFLQSRAAVEDFRYFGFAQHISGGPIPYTLEWANPKTTALEVDNRATISGLDDIQGYNPIHLARYDDYMAAVNGQRQNYHHADVFQDGLNSPLLDLLNVRYVVVPAVTPPDQIAPRFERPLSIVYEDNDVKILRNANALPRAWIVHAAEQVEPGQALERLASHAVDPARVALLEEPPPALASPTEPNDDRAELTSYDPDRLKLRTSTAAAGLLVLGEVDYPAWKAYVDDRPTPTYVADHVLRAVPIPGGAHQVEMRYESVPLLAGVVVSLCASILFASLVVATWIAPWIGRRHRDRARGRAEGQDRSGS